MFAIPIPFAQELSSWFGFAQLMTTLKAGHETPRKSYSSMTIIQQANQSITIKRPLKVNHDPFIVVSFYKINFLVLYKIKELPTQ